MNVIVSVECFKTLMKRKSKYPFFNGRTPLPKNWIKSRSYGHCKSLFLAVVLSWDIGFLGVQSQTSWNYIQVPLPPICRSLQKITTENRLWYSFSFNKPHHFPPPYRPSRDKTAAFFESKCKPRIRIAVVFYGWISTRIVPKNSDRNIKCPSVSARACHPSCCTLVSSDERQPPNMWQGRGPCGKWFGKCSIYSVSQCLAFQTCNLQTRYPFAMLI